MRRSYGSRRVYCAVCTLILISLSQVFSANKYVLKCRKDVLIESEKIMLSQVGIPEIPKNRGIAEVYLASVGLESGNPYCAAGQYYCYLQAVRKLKLSAKNIPIAKTGLSRKILSEASTRGIKVRYHPQRHDLIIWRKIGSSWQGHIERIISTGKAGWVTTVGFNVKMADGREGVSFKKRNMYHLIGKLRTAGIVGFVEVQND